MALFDKLNQKSRTIMEGIDLNSMEFKPLKDFIGQTINVGGFFFTDGKYGKQVVVVGNHAKINLPSRYVEKFEEIENDPEMLDAVLRGKLILTDVKSISTNNGNSTTFTFSSRD